MLTLSSPCLTYPRLSDPAPQITDASGEPRKACPRCRNVKSITEFHRKYADDPMSSQTYCRKCHGDMKKEKGGVRGPTRCSCFISVHKDGCLPAKPTSCAAHIHQIDNVLG